MSSKTFRATIVRDGSMCFIPLTFDPAVLRAVAEVASRSHEAIEEARRPETRARRIAGAVRMLKPTGK